MISMIDVAVLGSFLVFVGAAIVNYAVWLFHVRPIAETRGLGVSLFYPNLREFRQVVASAEGGTPSWARQFTMSLWVMAAALAVLLATSATLAIEAITG